MIRTLFFCFLAGVTFAQVVHLSSDNGVQPFLKNLGVKGVLEFSDNIKPFSRIEIAEYLLLAEKNKNRFTDLEKEELLYWKDEFYEELSFLNDDSIQTSYSFLGRRDSSRLNLFHYSDQLFSLTVNPILGFRFGMEDKNSFSHLWNGGSVYGYIGENIGFSLNFRDNFEKGQFRDRDKIFSRETGINPPDILLADDQLDYSEVRAELNYSWDWGYISLGKNFSEWGSGNDGKIILSKKAPSFASIKLVIQPVDWLYFQYMHGWLHSAIVDSGSIRTTSVENRLSYSQIEKYIAAHIFRIRPISNLNVSIGESVIYSGKPEFIYMIPVMFFRLADHYLQDRNSNSGDNAQLFADINYKFVDYNFELYGSVFIDELSLRGANPFTSGQSAVAFTFGTFIVDPYFKNTSITLEYSRLNPFVYMNSDDAQVFTSHNYQLGHWIGNNADELYFSIKTRITREIKINLWGDYIRKGSGILPQQQYELPYPDFLYGDVKDQFDVGFNANYEFYHDFIFGFDFKYSKGSLIATENNNSLRMSTFITFGF
ncbi:MAG: capsule assembly Wzi family protein [Melioribacteraceae bacterium]|nr:capsule assembly Wzi family protein [Melioribacteraceae bacterium]